MSYADGGFICAGITVGFIAWRFINNLQPSEYAIKNIATCIGITVGGVGAKYLDTADVNAAPSYFYGLVIGIVAYNVWGVIWRRALKNTNPEIVDAINELKAVTATLKTAVTRVKGSPSGSKITGG